MAYEFDCAGWSMEGLSSFKINYMVALCNTYTHIGWLPRRASRSFLEGLQVSLVLQIAMLLSMLNTCVS